MDWKWETVSLVCSTRTPFHDKVTDNGDGTFTHTLTPRQESAYVAGWRKIHSLSDLNPTSAHRWKWDGKDILCKDCGYRALAAPSPACVSRKFCSICGVSFKYLEGNLCAACDKADKDYPWPGYFCTTCGMYYPKVLLKGNVCPDCRLKRHDLQTGIYTNYYHCPDCQTAWDGRVHDREKLEAQVCEGPHAEHSTQHSRREGTHS